MSAAGKNDDVPAIATAVPVPVHGRDTLGAVCHYLHLAIMAFFLGGWAIPFHPVLIFYLFFIPGVAIQWQFNKNSCVLNNLESYIRYGTWRARENAEEGAWLMTLIKNATGIQLRPWQVEAITYGMLGVLWMAGLSHLLWW
jgi:hypothetical protein